SAGSAPNVVSPFRLRLVSQLRTVAPPEKLFTLTGTCWSVAVTNPPRLRDAPSSVPLTASQRRVSVVPVGVSAAIAIEPALIVRPKVDVPTVRFRLERPNVSSVALVVPP